MTDSPVIVDDVEGAIARLSALGRTVVEPAALSVRSAIAERAAAMGWTVVQHRAFAEWVDDVADSSCAWLILDPLIDTEELAPYASRLRVSRTLCGEQWRLDAVDTSALLRLAHGQNVGLVDDAAASGATLEYVRGLVRSIGATVARVALCCSRLGVRQSFAEAAPNVQWKQFVEGSRIAIHMRDACPYLPYSGRPSGDHPPIQGPNGMVRVKLPSMTRKGGLWPRVLSDYRVLAATVRARSEVAERLSMALGREALVTDIPLLGEEIALPAFPRHAVTEGTALRDIT